MEINWKQIIGLKWFKQYYMIFIYGFFLNFSLLSPYRFEFYKQYKNVTEQDLTQDYLPINIYAIPIKLIFVLLLVDITKYSIFNILTPLYAIISLGILIWGKTTTDFIVAQVFSGFRIASQLAYFVCIYVHCKRERYRLYTALIRVAPLVAVIISSLLGYLFVATDGLKINQIVYFDFTALIIAIILTIFLPKAEEQDKLEKEISKPRQLLENLKAAFPNKYVVKWTLWIALSLCSFNQTTTFIQPFWETLGADMKHNGAVECLNAFIIMIGTLLGGFARYDWKYKGDLILSLASLVQGFMLLFMSQFTGIILNYVFYIGFNFIFHFTLTMVIAETVKFLKNGCFGITFGFAALIGMILNSIVIFVLNEETGINLEYKDKFMMYGFYQLIVSVSYIVIGLTYWFAKSTFV